MAAAAPAMTALATDRGSIAPTPSRPMPMALAGALLLQAVVLAVVTGPRSEFLTLEPTRSAIDITVISEPPLPAAPVSPAPAETLPEPVPAEAVASDGVEIPLTAEPFGPAPADPGTPAPASRAEPPLSVLGGETGLWSLVCQGLDPALFDRRMTCPEPGAVLQAGRVRDPAAGLIDPEAEMRAVLGPAYQGMSLAEIRAAFGGRPLFNAPGLDALPMGPAITSGPRTAADDARDRLPASVPDPVFGD